MALCPSLRPSVRPSQVEPCAAPVAPPPPKFSIGAPNAAAAEIFDQRRRKSAARLKMRPSPKDSQ